MNSMAVRMLGITKSFNGVCVLDKVDFELRTGEVHALLGENGAGKSTLMKILRGVYTLDSGQIEVNGQPVHIHSPRDARMHGIAMVFQEFSLVPSLTVAQNIFLNREPRKALGLIDDAEMQRRATELFERLGVPIAPSLRVAELSTGYRQLTEIASALSQEGRILILDEPTASLTRGETEALFEIMQRLKSQGISIIYISHRMEEIFQVADRITVLRDGQRIISEDAAKLDIQQVIEHIIGRKTQSSFEWRKHEVDRTAEPLLDVKDLSAPPVLSHVSFRLYPGEVLGLAGLMGSGRTELVTALFGINRMKSGRVNVRGRPVHIHRSEEAVANGIALVPEDRRTQGLILGHTLRENLLLPTIKLGRLNQGTPLVDDNEGDRIAQSYINMLKIRAPSIYTLVRTLSGGNQQKVVIGKWLSTDPDILLLDEPTAGVDIGTKGEIIEIIRQLASAGKGLILVSSELPELLAVADRILILRNGQVQAELDRAEITSEEELHRVLQGANNHE